MHCRLRRNHRGSVRPCQLDGGRGEEDAAFFLAAVKESCGGLQRENPEPRCASGTAEKERARRRQRDKDICLREVSVSANLSGPAMRGIASSSTDGCSACFSELSFSSSAVSAPLLLIPIFIVIVWVIVAVSACHFDFLHWLQHR